MSVVEAALYVPAGADRGYPGGAAVDVLPLPRAGIPGPVNGFAR